MAKPAPLLINPATVQRLASDTAFVTRFPFLARASLANAPAKGRKCCLAKRNAQQAQGIAVVMRTLAGMAQAEINQFLTMLNVNSAKVLWSADGKNVQTSLLTKS